VRVKVGRRLQRIGAVALKNTVYLLPNTPAAREDFEWVLREVISNGGEAAVVEAHLVGGLSDDEIERLFQEARDADYRAIEEETQEVARRLAAVPDKVTSRQLGAEVRRLERRLEEVQEIDYLNAPERLRAAGRLAELRHRLAGAPEQGAPFRDVGSAQLIEDMKGRIWVTRAGVHVDRIASAWLVRRFVDPGARFRFVAGETCHAAPDEVRFDMFEAEFTHEGDRCTFEVLCERLALTAPGVLQIAELVHDVDTKDGKFCRPEAAGLAALIAGITALFPDDETRLTRGAEVLDALREHFAGGRQP
jgi:hypothetical protein